MKIIMLVCLRIFLVICLLQFATSATFAQDWLNKIVPLQTSIADLSQIIGKVSETHPNEYFFKLREGNLFVAYSPGVCVQGKYGQWNIREGIVTNATFYPTKKRPPTWYKIDLVTMTLTNDGGQQLYSDEIAGKSYWTQFGKISSIALYPPKAKQDMRCISP